MKDAYMIRNDGNVFECAIHPYIIPDDLLLSLEKGEWFYDHTLNTSTKLLYIDFVAWFIRYQLCITENFESFITMQFDRDFYGVTEKFLMDNLSMLTKSWETISEGSSCLDLLERETNQEFLRVRYGGRFESSKGVKEIYFRVSSTRFNWYNYIWQFVNDNKSQIDNVTIVKDEVVFGTGKPYKGKNGFYDHVPTDEFLTEIGNPVIEWKNKNISVVRHLEMGGTISGILDLPINNKQAWATYLKLEEYEKRFPQFYLPFKQVISEVLAGSSIREVISKY